MLFQAPPTNEPVKVSVFSTFALTFCVAAVVGIGIYPEPLVELCEAVAAVVAR
jgi:NADH:ubiquinone oxidoreductase subunit 2 (subunit N)